VDQAPKAEFWAALLAARQEFPAIRKDAENGHLHNRYASLASTLDVEDALHKHGLQISQTPVPVEHGWALQTKIAHTSGQELAGLVPLVIPSSGNVMQGLGSAITYARRYGLQCLLSLVAEDDDGQGAGQHQQQPQRAQAPQQQQRGKWGDTAHKGGAPKAQAVAFDPARPPADGRALFAVLSKAQEAGRPGMVRGCEKWMQDMGFEEGTKIKDLAGSDVAEFWSVLMEDLGLVAGAV
jgi:hypothetical protein